MQQNHKIATVVVFLCTITVGIILIIVVASWVASTTPTNSGNSALQQAAAQSAVLPTIVPTIATEVPTLIVTKPTEVAGELIALPTNLTVSGLVKIKRTLSLPRLNQEQAMRAVRSPYAMGGIIKGQKIYITATFGLVTHGELGKDGKTWAGYQNIQLLNCSSPAPKDCKPNGKVLDHIEDRPMWVLDYKNLPSGGAGSPNNPPPVYNHTVYVVDDETGVNIFSWGYSEP